MGRCSRLRLWRVWGLQLPIVGSSFLHPALALPGKAVRGSGTPKRGVGSLGVGAPQKRYLLAPCPWQSIQLPRVVSASSMAYYTLCCLRLIPFR